MNLLFSSAQAANVRIPNVSNYIVNAWETRQFVDPSVNVTRRIILRIIASITLIIKMQGKQLSKKFLKEISKLLNQRSIKTKVNITKDANVKHQIVKRNIVNALREEFPVIQINVNVRIARMENATMMHTSNLKINKWFT